jgi:cysteine synthase A
VPAVPYRDPNNYVRYSQRLAEALDRSEDAGAVWANQFDNLANRHIHETTTAEEIWSDTGGTIDGFVAAVGSGGTLGGVARCLKAKRADVRIALADPPGSALYAYYTTGILKAEGSSITEGIGQGRITKNLEGAPVDTAYRIPDDEALRVVFDLLAEEGLCVGASSGVNVAGAMRLARDLGPGHTIVTILCDPGTRYQSRLFDAAYLRTRSLPVPEWLAREPRALPEVFAQTKAG